MTFLKAAGDRIWSFISPRKTQQRREKEFKAKVAPLPAILAHEEPNTVAYRVTNWKVGATDREGSLGAVNLPPSPPTSLSPDFDDFEGDTLDVGSAGELHRAGSEVWDANEETIVVDEDRYIAEQKTVDRDEERRRREAQGHELRAAGWSEDAIFLFQKLGMRGFEPILPYSWVEDFKSLPVDLFTPNMDKAFIKPMFDQPDNTADFRAFKALETLFQLGGRVRDAVKQKAKRRTPEWHIRRAVRDYDKWAIKDANLDDIYGSLSPFKILSADNGTRSDVMEAKMRAHLLKLAEDWQTAFDAREEENAVSNHVAPSLALPKIPTLYGVIVSHTIMAFVSYDATTPDAPLRTVAIFDFGLEGYDVWNALAVSIFVIHARNRLVQLSDFLPTVEITTEESDPDR